MIQIVKRENCCGCGACVQVCPEHCIEMKSDSEGFDYPAADKVKCIDCGQCDSVCPELITSTQTMSHEEPTAHVAYAKDDSIRMASSSGGLFSVLAEAILRKNGVVYGAAFDERQLVHHIRVDRKEDLWELRGSKYLQSRMENRFQDAAKDLQDGKLVLFSGTGCQIAGLKSFLKQEYDNLFTIDVLCHGVPSPKLWKHYLSEQERAHGAAVRRTFFRQKDFGWKTFALSLDFTNGRAYVKRFQDDSFMQLFLKNICLRPACYQCRFKAIVSQADITLGDCWGIEKYMPDMDDDRGTSVILVHTEKGNALLHDVSPRLIIRRAAMEGVAQPMIWKSVNPHRKRELFFKKLNSSASFESLVDLLSPTFMERAKRKIRNVLK